MRRCWSAVARVNGSESGSGDGRVGFSRSHIFDTSTVENRWPTLGEGGRGSRRGTLRGTTSTSVRVLTPFGAFSALLAKPGILQIDLTNLEGTREPLRVADQLARCRENTRRARADVEAAHHGDNPEGGTRHAEPPPPRRALSSSSSFLPDRRRRRLRMPAVAAHGGARLCGG